MIRTELMVNPAGRDTDGKQAAFYRGAFEGGLFQVRGAPHKCYPSAHMHLPKSTPTPTGSHRTGLSANMIRTELMVNPAGRDTDVK